MRTLIVLFAAALAAAERKRPLRPRTRPQKERLVSNLATFAVSAAVVAVMQPLLVGPVVERVRKERRGLLQQIRMPPALRLAAGVLLLDYTLWWWHWMSHRFAPLWHFHRIHHADPDLDASTALRFHVGEMSLSMFYRMLQVRLLGTDARALTAWNYLLMPSVLFHHSNLRLPEDADRALANVLVTPRMHGIHHSDVYEETNSNWSSLFTWWDRLHSTLLLDVPQEVVVIGPPTRHLRLTQNGT
jgi:sterol desaturase/sphingolipid hydroxylase (fatty acid hydroxylase superfamily)